MTTACEAIMVSALEALESPTRVATQVKRAHLTLLPKEKGDTVHLIDGDDVPASGGGARCGKRRMHFITSIFVRSDVAGAADSYKIAIAARFKETAWPAGARLDPPGKITINTEIADDDATRVDMEWIATYATDGEWSLEFPA
jgi:hypothetical protein